MKAILKDFYAKETAGVQDEFTTPNGTFYVFYTEWEYGKKGETNSKSQSPNWKKGSEYELTITEDSRGDKIKMKPVEGYSGNSGGYNNSEYQKQRAPFEQGLITAQSTMAKSIELILSGKVTFKDAVTGTERLPAMKDLENYTRGLMTIQYNLAKEFENHGS